MKVILGAVAGLLLVAAGPGGRARDGVTIKDLQGVWRGARFTEGRGEKPDDGVKIDLVFKGPAVSVRKASGAPVGEATVTIGEDGRRVDATGTSGGYRGKTYVGILKVEEDTLTWCVAGTAGKDQKRPAAFAADPGQAHYLIVAKRQKP